MKDDILGRLSFFSRDGSLDIDDVDDAVALAEADGRLSAEEIAQLKEGLTRFRDKLEPAARRYLEDVIAGKARSLVNALLLAPHPRGQPRDAYYPRSEVVALQERLTWLGYPTVVDGDFGPATARSLAKFQTKVNVPGTGVLDSRTLVKLNSALRAAGREPLDLNQRARIRPDQVIAVKGAGDRARVGELQKSINHLAKHYGLGITALKIDGDFGAKTEAALKAVQAALYLPETGIFDVATAQAMNVGLQSANFAALAEDVPRSGANHAGNVELHFYPNAAEFKCYVLRGGKVLDTYAMVGGEPVARASTVSDSVRVDPTPKGRYKVETLSPHTSSVWPRSYVPYGAQLREVSGEIQFREEDGDWRFATGPSSVFKDRNPPALLPQHYKNPDGTLPAIYTGSDFGHLRALLRDVNTGVQQTHMIHPIPTLEDADYWADTDSLLAPTAALATLRYSHGCEHMHPRDLDEMVAKGYLAPGTIFVVHGYDERFGQ